MRQRSNRGAARVGAVWLVVFVIFFLAAIAVAWSQADKASKTQEELVAARADLDTGAILVVEAGGHALSGRGSFALHQPGVSAGPIGGSLERSGVA